MTDDPFEQANADQREQAGKFTYQQMLAEIEKADATERRAKGTAVTSVGSIDNPPPPAPPAPTPEEPKTGFEAATADIDVNEARRKQAETEDPKVDLGPALWDVYKGTLAENWLVGGASEFASEFLRDMADGTRAAEEYYEQLRAELPEGSVTGASPAWMHEPQTEFRTEDALELTASKLPKPDRPETVTGSFLWELSKFGTALLLMKVPATSMVKSGKAALGMTGDAGWGTLMATGALNGAMADILIRAEGNIFNAAQEIGIEDDVVDFLATDPNDTEAENRLKNVVVGAGIGSLADTFVPMVRLLRSGKKAVGETALDAAADKIGTISEEDIIRAFKVQADDAAERSVAAGRLADRLAKADGLDPGSAARLADELAVKVDEAFNWSRIETIDDVEEGLRTILGANFDAVEEGRALGRALSKVEEEAAEAAPLTLSEVLRRSDGELWSDVKTLQLRNLLLTMTEKTNELAVKAASASGSTADLYAWRKMESITAAIAERTLNLRADQSRALGQWRISAKTDPLRAVSLEESLRAAGGKDELLAIARKKAELIKRGIDVPPMHDPTLTTGRKVGEAATKLAVSGMLWTTGSHFKNIMSGISVMLQEPAERFAATGIRAVKGTATDVGVERGEAAIMAKATMRALGSAFRAARIAWRDGQSTLGGLARQKIEGGAVGKPIFEAPFSSDTTLGRVGNALEKFHSGSARMLMTTDEFFKMIGYEAELHALALRTVRQEARNAGENLSPEDIATRIKAIVDDPPDSLRFDAINAANYRTFTDEADGFFVQAIKAARANDPTHHIFATHVAPFVNTPARALSYSLERFPLPGVQLASRTFRKELAAGGARADIVQARMAVGFAMGGLMLEAALDERLTGPRIKDSGRANVFENAGGKYEAVWVETEDGGQWISYGFMDQYAGAMAFAGSIAEIMRQKQLHPENQDQIGEAVAALGLAVAAATVDRSYMQGASDAMELVSGGLTSGVAWTRYLNQRAQVYIPFSGVLKQLERGVSPEIENVPGFPVVSPLFGEAGGADFLRAMMAGLSDSLPDKIGIDGEPINSDPPFHLMSSFVPIRVSKSGDEVPAYAKEMDRLAMRWEPIPIKVTFNPDQVTGLQRSVEFDLTSYPRVKERLDIIAGKVARDEFGRTRVEALNDLIENDPTYGLTVDSIELGIKDSSFYSDEEKANQVSDKIVYFDRLARKILIEEARESEDPQMAMFFRKFSEKANTIPPEQKKFTNEVLEMSGAMPEFN